MPGVQPPLWYLAPAALTPGEGVVGCGVDGGVGSSVVSYNEPHWS